jgi:formylglycine-generating enzyme required for sulfatase activity/FKBP-type peptidyl-prolyl cis-trans isomerase
MRKKEIKKEGSVAVAANTLENGVLKILKGMKTILIPLSAVMCLFLTLMCAPGHHHPAEPEMVFVQGGTFRMGGANGHEVRLSSFSIGKYEVTQAQWKALMGSNPSEFKGGNLPVENVSWEDVREFIERLNVATGKQYRLPTEAEWEYAAQGGNKSRAYEYSGSNSVEDVAWMNENSGSKTHPVGAKKANELGIYDMSGNVWEWCRDWYGAYPASAQNNPVGPSSGSARVNRGGGWFGGESACRVVFRDIYSPGYRDRDLGFRLACSSDIGERVNNGSNGADGRLSDDGIDIKLSSSSKPMDPVSYAIGIFEAYTTLEHIEGSHLNEVDYDKLIKGFESIILNNDSIKDYDKQWASEIINRYFNEKMDKQAEADRKEGAAFLEKNRENNSVTVLPSGLQYKVVNEGTGISPEPSDTVSFIYTGTLIDGTVFDVSRGGKPVKLPMAQLIPGWKEGFPLMKEGAKYMFYIPSDLAYGNSGQLAGKTLIYDVELVSVHKGSAD